MAGVIVWSLLIINQAETQNNNASCLINTVCVCVCGYCTVPPQCSHTQGSFTHPKNPFLHQTTELSVIQGNISSPASQQGIICFTADELKYSGFHFYLFLHSDNLLGEHEAWTCENVNDLLWLLQSSAQLNTCGVGVAQHQNLDSNQRWSIGSSGWVFH